MRLIRLLVCAICLASASPLFAQAKFRAGAATSNITPPLGAEVIGGFRPYPADHIHDELHARCLVLDNGEAKLAFVVLDLLGADRAVFDEARKLVKDET